MACLLYLGVKENYYNQDLDALYSVNKTVYASTNSSTPTPTYHYPGGKSGGILSVEMKQATSTVIFAWQRFYATDNTSYSRFARVENNEAVWSSWSLVYDHNLLVNTGELAGLASALGVPFIDQGMKDSSYNLNSLTSGAVFWSYTNLPINVPYPDNGCVFALSMRNYIIQFSVISTNTSGKVVYT